MNGGGGPLLITGLNEYTVYEFQVFASTRIGAGPSEVVIQRTEESCKVAKFISLPYCVVIPLCIYSYIDPYAPPRDVQSSVTGSRTATISWIPPVAEHHNGPIIYYTVVDHNEAFNVSDVVINATNTDYNLTNLEEYSTYRLRVAAATKIGLGPYPEEFNTPQDGKLSHYVVVLMMCLHCRDEFRSTVYFTMPLCILHSHAHAHAHTHTHTLTHTPAPSAPPQSFMGYSQSPTLISLVWLPSPDIDLNGVLQQYVIQVKEVWTE